MAAFPASSGLGAKLASFIPSLGHLLSSGAASTGASSTVSPAAMSSMLNVSASPSPTTTAGLANIGSSFDPGWQGVIDLIKAQKANPWMTATEGLGDLGKTLLEAKLARTLPGYAHPAQPNTQQPGPLQFTGSPAPASPIAVAALIEQLL